MSTSEQPQFKTIDSADFLKNNKDFLKAFRSPKGGTRKSKGNVATEETTISMVIPKVMYEAKDKLIEEVFGGEKAWAEAHSQGTVEEKLGLENISSVYIGQKYKNGKPTQNLCIVVKVFEKPEEKNALKRLSRKFRIPKKIKVGDEFVLTDVRIGQRVSSQAAVGGNACGVNRANPNGQYEAGKITCFCNVKWKGKEYLHLISNSHVFGKFFGAKYGDEVKFPFGPGGSVIGYYFDSGPDDVDVAVATVKNGAPVDENFHNGFGHSEVVRRAKKDERVLIYGKRHQQDLEGTVKEGIVKGTDISLPWPYPWAGTHVLKDLFSIEHVDGPGTQFSLGGDSGSLIVSKSTGEMLGILVGATESAPWGSFAQQLIYVRQKMPGIVSFLPATKK